MLFGGRRSRAPAGAGSGRELVQRRDGVAVAATQVAAVGRRNLAAHAAGKNVLGVAAEVEVVPVRRLAMLAVGSWEWNLETDRIIWSDELYKLFDLKKENQNLQLTQFFDFIHPNDKERVLNSIYTVKSNKPFTADRFRILTTTGLLKHIEARGSQTQ